MLQVPNYQVVAPYIPDLRFTTKMRTTADGDRNELRYSLSGANTNQIVLPWKPTAPEWVEVYVDGFRLINPRVTSDSTVTSVVPNTGGTLYETFNVVGSTIYFNYQIEGDILVLCDTKGSHYSHSVIIQPKNHQAVLTSSTVANVVVLNTEIIGGNQRGFRFTVSYNVGPKFETNSYVILTGNNPVAFNGNFQVKSSTPGSVSFTGNTANVAVIHSPGIIHGFATTYDWSKNVSTALYAEPVILTQPVHGSARLTTDRTAIAYVPDIYHAGNDTFSWALITQHGQIGDPKCVYIKTTRI